MANLQNFTCLSCDFTHIHTHTHTSTHLNTHKHTHKHMNTHTKANTHTHTHVLSVNINLPSVRSAMCQPTIQFTVSRSPLQHSVAERKLQQTVVFRLDRFVRTSEKILRTYQTLDERRLELTVCGGNAMLTVTYCAILKVQSVLKSIYCNVDLYNITI